jgi:leucyl/phenylalanyl-tRNA--protein transferase
MSDYPIYLSPNDPLPLPRLFEPNPEFPDGLIAITNSITPKRLIEAYQKGIFPWPSEDFPILWWFTSPRMTLCPEDMIIRRSLRKKIQQVLLNPAWEIRVDTAFAQVIKSCANSPRQGQNGTWITPEIQENYLALSHQGIAHSVETWYQGELVGGLYGINLGQMFYGESMFMKVADASKIALAALCARCLQVQIELIDCQQETTHLTSLGGKLMDKMTFLDKIDVLTRKPSPQWGFDKEVLAHWL